jgi:hypothetical protein
LTAIARRAAELVSADSAGVYASPGEGEALELLAMHDPGPTVEAAPTQRRLLIPLRAGRELVGLLVCAWAGADRGPAPRSHRRLLRLGAPAW